MAETVRFRLGERKMITIRVNGCNGGAFQVKSANYVLKNGNDVEESGTCIIEQIGESVVDITALIEPKIPNNTYELTFTYEIQPEILKYMVRIHVY